MEKHHEDLLRLLQRTIDVMDAMPYGKHPLFEQLLQLLLQALMVFLENYLTPAPPEAITAP